ncbi:MAG: cytochrome c [Chloroflexi bacterium]|nr:cytochrome c [Chloroflexota bacterium]
MKRFLIICTLLIAGALLLGACGSGQGAAPAATSAPAGPVGDATAGKTKFEGTCSSCHGPDAKGLPGLGKDLTTSAFAMGLSDGDLLAFVKTGRPSSDPANTTGVDMPPKGGNPALSDQDLADIIAYVRTLEK